MDLLFLLDLVSEALKCVFQFVILALKLLHHAKLLHLLLFRDVQLLFEHLILHLQLLLHLLQALSRVHLVSEINLHLITIHLNISSINYALSQSVLSYS